MPPAGSRRNSGSTSAGLPVSHRSSSQCTMTGIRLWYSATRSFGSPVSIVNVSMGEVALVPGLPQAGEREPAGTLKADLDPPLGGLRVLAERRGRDQAPAALGHRPVGRLRGDRLAPGVGHRPA